jgi:hypothetical protein
MDGAIEHTGRGGPARKIVPRTCPPSLVYADLRQKPDNGPSLSELRAGYFVWPGSMAVFVLGTALATVPQHATEVKQIDRPLELSSWPDS